MTEQYRALIGKNWITVAEVFGKEISKNALPFMLDAISDLDPASVLSALQKWVQTSKLGRHPLPAELREAINSLVDKKAFATELARKIDKAISRHGYNWDKGFFGPNGIYWENDQGHIFTSFKEAVISEIGPVGWHVVCARGGWLNTRNSANEMEQGIFFAQMREQIAASLQLSEQGVDVAKIVMPTKEKTLGHPDDYFKIEKPKSLRGDE